MAFRLPKAVSLGMKAGVVPGSSLGARSVHADVRRPIDRVLAEGWKRRSVSQLLDPVIVAHCVDVDPQKIPDSSRDPEGGRSAPAGITTANLVFRSPTSSAGIRLSNWPYSVSSPAPGRLFVRPLASA